MALNAKCCALIGKGLQNLGRVFFLLAEAVPDIGVGVNEHLIVLRWLAPQAVCLLGGR